MWCEIYCKCMCQVYQRIDHHSGSLVSARRVEFSRGADARTVLPVSEASETYTMSPFVHLKRSAGKNCECCRKCLLCCCLACGWRWEGGGGGGEVNRANGSAFISWPVKDTHVYTNPYTEQNGVRRVRQILSPCCLVCPMYQILVSPTATRTELIT